MWYQSILLGSIGSITDTRIGQLYLIRLHLHKILNQGIMTNIRT